VLLNFPALKDGEKIAMVARIKNLFILFFWNVVSAERFAN
jgi:hypothetical protein